MQNKQSAQPPPKPKQTAAQDTLWGQQKANNKKGNKHTSGLGPTARWTQSGGTGNSRVSFLLDMRCSKRPAGGAVGSCQRRNRRKALTTLLKHFILRCFYLPSIFSINPTSLDPHRESQFSSPHSTSISVFFLQQQLSKWVEEKA